MIGTRIATGRSRRAIRPPGPSPVIAAISPRPGLASEHPADSASIPIVVCSAIWL